MTLNYIALRYQVQWTGLAAKFCAAKKWCQPRSNRYVWDDSCGRYVIRLTWLRWKQISYYYFFSKCLKMKWNQLVFMLIPLFLISSPVTVIGIRTRSVSWHEMFGRLVVSSDVWCEILFSDKASVSASKGVLLKHMWKECDTPLGLGLHEVILTLVAGLKAQQLAICNQWRIWTYDIHH